MQPISSLPVGAKVKFGKYKVESSAIESMIWLVAGHNHYRDELNPGIVDHVTLIPWKIIDLRGFDAKEPSNSNTDRQTYGNNRYLHSNLRQWLNKEGYPWYVNQHGADAPPNDAGMNQPTGYDDELGFLSSFSENEVAAILDTTLTVAKNTVTDGGGSETVTDKVFLLSSTEVGLANENSIVEGSLIPLFSDDVSRKAFLTQQAFSNTKSGSKPSTINDTWYWWLRTPYASYSRSVRNVGTSGTLGGITAYAGGSGVRPALNLKSDILVSDTVDSDGCYNVVWQIQHIITLDKPISIQAGEMVEKVKFNPKINGTSLNLKSTDEEKLIYTGENLNTDTVNLEIEGKDGKIDKIAYTIS